MTGPAARDATVPRRAPAAIPQAAALLAGGGQSRCRIVMGSPSTWRVFWDDHAKAASVSGECYPAGSMLLSTAMSAVFCSSVSRRSALIAPSMSGGGASAFPSVLLSLCSSPA